MHKDEVCTEKTTYPSRRGAVHLLAAEHRLAHKVLQILLSHSDLGLLVVHHLEGSICVCIFLHQLKAVFVYLCTCISSPP